MAAAADGGTDSKAQNGKANGRLKGHLSGPEFEFFGPYLGPLAIMLGLPLVCYGLVYACNSSGCMHLAPKFSIPGFPPAHRLFTWQALGVYVAWFVAQALLHLLLPGQRRQGVALPDGSRLTYKLNGLRNMVVSVAAVLYFGFYRRSLDLGWVYDNYLPLITASIIFSAALSAYVYAASFARGAVLAKGGNTGRPLYDFFIGRELNPRLGGFDIKEFCEVYPGLIGWVVIDLAMAHKQLTSGGGLSAGMVLVCAFQALYVLDALWFEPAILTTMDITSDGFGFMLAFGDLAWVPFTYSLQARVLVDHSQPLSVAAIAGIVALKALGYLVFRGSNSQKDQFRRDPAHPRVASLRTLPTERGTRLIISGWWGIARHINYTGDWLMGLAWCLPTGLQSPIPYFYAIYFLALLMHRDRRDDHACRAKYGRDWDKFCGIVKYRLFPLLY
ncbi:hypothetical protein D9Q98_000617 [Chlorella vulgaris]|uniref:Delta(14)-sterol reductase ERG24 n=1 Tax=Chlorella vulgaris TaxID=3077 RepID=A0A9D4TYN9_CHLVU|nr:hypothetical protein D9Q98_000617 [Chlorella vulgaris]